MRQLIASIGFCIHQLHAQIARLFYLKYWFIEEFELFLRRI